jgi:hypothetical protein
MPTASQVQAYVRENTHAASLLDRLFGAEFLAASKVISQALEWSEKPASNQNLSWMWVPCPSSKATASTGPAEVTCETRWASVIVTPFSSLRGRSFSATYATYTRECAQRLTIQTKLIFFSKTSQYTSPSSTDQSMSAPTQSAPAQLLFHCPNLVSPWFSSVQLPSYASGTRVRLDLRAAKMMTVLN